MAVHFIFDLIKLSSAHFDSIVVIIHVFLYHVKGIISIVDKRLQCCFKANFIYLIFTCTVQVQGLLIKITFYQKTGHVSMCIFKFCNIYKNVNSSSFTLS